METEAAAADPPRLEVWPFRFHDLRHLSATEMVGQGIDPRTVASRLGHADPSVTLRVYAHAIEQRDREAAEGLGLALAPPAGIGNRIRHDFYANDVASGVLERLFDQYAVLVQRVSEHFPLLDAPTEPLKCRTVERIGRGRDVAGQ
jgi:hypothetical protein